MSQSSNVLDYFSIHNGCLHIDGVSIIELSKLEGTPFYAYDLNIVRQKYQQLRNILVEEIDVFFAVKANPSLAVCAYLNTLGAGAEIVSEGELEVVLAAGFSTDRIIFNGPGKTRQAIFAAIKAGVKLFNVESTNDLERISKCAEAQHKHVKVCIRLNPSLSSSDALISTGGSAQKFGVDQVDVHPLIQTVIESELLELAGIHIFEGSQVLSQQSLIASMSNTLLLAKQLETTYQCVFEDVNLGGGIGVQYLEEGSEFDIMAFSKSLNKLLADRHSHLKDKREKVQTRLILELGRYLVADSGVYVTEVLDVKMSQGQHYIITDGGINHALLPITKNQYPIFLANKMTDEVSVANYIGGPLCTSADMTPVPVLLPKAEPGDLVVMCKSGAYGFSASMLNFLSFNTPAEIVLNNGEGRVVRSAGKATDFIQNQCI